MESGSGWTRRDFTATGLAAGFALAGAPMRADAQPSAIAASDVLVNVTLADGTRWNFDGAAGKNLGAYMGPVVRQACYRVDLPNVPLSVFIRPDLNSDRLEVIFELGRCWGAMNAAAAHLGSYTATITRKSTGAALARQFATRHWWGSRWRWKSSERPVVRTFADIAKHLPPYSTKALIATPPPVSNEARIRYAGPMDNAGVDMNVGDAGERSDIGPITEIQAKYLLTGDSASLSALLAQAEASGSFPIFLRDENTNACLDFRKYPSYEFRGGNGKIKSYQDLKAGSCPWRLDIEHDPALDYVPFLLTDDPYYLENLQFRANWALGWSSYHRGDCAAQGHKFLLIPFIGAPRAIAWGLRTFIHACEATPAAVPSWLIGKNYWKQCLGDTATWATLKYVHNPNQMCVGPDGKGFHVLGEFQAVGAFKSNFIIAMLGFGVRLGHDDLRPVYEYARKFTDAMTNGKSGWPQRIPGPYNLPLLDKGSGQNIGYTEQLATAKATDGTKGLTPLPNWAAAYQRYLALDAANVAKGSASSLNPNAPANTWEQANDPSYLIYPRAVLAQDAALGYSNSFDVIDGYARHCNGGAGYMMYKWAWYPTP